MYKTIAYIVRKIGGREVREMIGEKTHDTECAINQYCNKLCNRYRSGSKVLCVDIYQNGEYQVTRCF